MFSYSDSNEVFIKVGGRRRVYNITINGTKLDLLKNYTIVSNSFILEGGDDYSMFTSHETIKNAISVDN